VSFEYRLRLKTVTGSERSTARSDADLWMDLARSFARTGVYVGATDGCITLKSPTEVSAWTFDVRLFDTAPVLMEISSWNDDIRTVVTQAFRSVRSLYDFDVVDDDGQPVELDPR